MPKTPMQQLTEAAREMQSALVLAYRDAVALRGLAEAEYASLARGDRRETMADIATVREVMHAAIDRVRMLEDARKQAQILADTLEAI